MVFSIIFYMVFPLEHKIEHAGRMLSYAIIDSGSTWQMLAIFLEAVEAFGKYRITGFINKAGNQIQLELNLNLIPPLWLPTVGHVLKEFNLNLILWLCCVLVPDPSFFFYIGWEPEVFHPISTPYSPKRPQKNIRSWFRARSNSFEGPMREMRISRMGLV